MHLTIKTGRFEKGTFDSENSVDYLPPTVQSKTWLTGLALPATDSLEQNMADCTWTACHRQFRAKHG